MVNCISATEFKTLIQSVNSIDVVDFRTEIEFREVHIEVTCNEPLDQFNPQAIQAVRSETANEPLYIVCRSDSRDRQACENFMAAGFPNVINIEGGTIDCQAVGFRMTMLQFDRLVATLPVRVHAIKHSDHVKSQSML